MKRRKAILGIGLLGTLGVGSYSGIKWYSWNKSPDIAHLKDQRELISSLVETIIPETDTPGAKSAGVHDFVINMVTDCSNIQSKNKFIDGLKDLEAYCHDEFEKSYVACSEEQQNEVMSYFAKKGKPLKGIVGKAEKKFLGQSFFTTLKQYTTIGYCTSELGATEHLAYLPVPGKLVGCVDLKPGQKSWAIE